jgi:glutathione S-transferase
MTPTLYVADWAPYQYLIDAMLRVKPMPGLAIRAYAEMDHPIARERGAVTPFIAYQDENPEAVFTFLATAETLDRRFPDIRLCGETPLMRGVVRSFCQVIEEGFTALTGSRAMDIPGYDGPMWHASSRAPDAFAETFYKKIVAAERFARDTRFLLADQPYLCDIILAASCWYARDLGRSALTGDQPRLNRWHDQHCFRGLFTRL